MRVKHKLLQDFQFISEDKKIFILEKGNILEEYIYSFKNEDIPVDKDIVDNNPQFFQLLDWKTELLLEIKSKKISQPSQVHKKIIPFIESMILSNSSKRSYISDHRLEDIEERENRIKSREDDIKMSFERLDKREENYKEDIEKILEREKSIKDQLQTLSKLESEILEKSQEISERERNIEKELLNSSKTDDKYNLLKKKIEGDLSFINKRERELNKREEKIKEDEFILKSKITEFDKYAKEITRLDEEIKNWENLHWKLKRMNKPPSTLDN